MEAYNLLKELASPLGIIPALFTVDYRDKENNYYHQELTTMVPPTVTPNDVYRQITLEALELFGEKGYTVYSIDRVLDGLTYDELQALYNKSAGEARKHVMTVYRDFCKERDMVKYPSVNYGGPHNQRGKEKDTPQAATSEVSR